MKQVKKIFKYLFTDQYQFLDYFVYKLAPYIKSDSLYLRLYYQAKMHRSLNLKNPKTFNEKLQWLKLNDRNPLYCKMVDKIEAKKIVSKIIGDKYIIPTIGQYDTVNDVDWDSLPNQFVIKCSHDSGGIVVCKDKSNLNIEEAVNKLAEGLNMNFYDYNREWAYKNVKPRIIIEQYMEDNKTKELRDYKFFCFDGTVKALFIASDRQKPGEETKFDFFDSDFNHLPIKNGHPNSSVLPDKPESFEEMKAIASKLSKGIPEVRVDLYEVNGKVFFGELTFFHWSGVVPFDPESWDVKFGSWIKI